MRNYPVFILLAVLLMSLSCKNEKAAVATQGAVVEQQEFPTSRSEIFKTVSEIKAIQDTLKERGPITVAKEDGNVEVTAYIQATFPVIIHAQYPKKEEWFYLQNRQVIMLQEVVYAENGGGIEERQFFYTQEEVLESRGRQAPSLDSLNRLSFEKLKLTKAEAGFQMDPVQVNMKAINFLYGK